MCTHLMTIVRVSPMLGRHHLHSGQVGSTVAARVEALEMLTVSRSCPQDVPKYNLARIEPVLQSNKPPQGLLIFSAIWI